MYAGLCCNQPSSSTVPLTDVTVLAYFRYDVHVQAVAEVDRVYVVAFEVGVHDGEKDLQEEIDGI